MIESNFNDQKKSSELGLVGTSYKFSSIEFRESLMENFDDFASDFEGCDEKFVLITCNRIEVYFISENTSNILEKYAKDSRYYTAKGKDVVKHLLLVSLGLDSFLPGEESIYYQIKNSFIKSLKNGEVKSSLKCIINRTLSLSKKLRKAGLITSKKEIASEIAKKAVDYLNQQSFNAVIIGSGRTAKTIYEYLKGYSKSISIVTSRKLYNAEFPGARVYSYQELREAFEGSDIIFSATTTAPKDYIIDEDFIKGLQNKPKLVVDLGVPRNINPNVKNMGITYWDMEEIYKITKNDNIAPEYLDSMLKQESDSIYLAAYYKKIRPEIKNIMKRAYHIINEEALIAEKHLKDNEHDTDYVLKKMAERTVKKLLGPILSNPKNEDDLKSKINVLEALGAKNEKDSDSHKA
jgi:glutamyl-tRNA reductase